MKKVGIIGLGTDIRGFLHEIKEHEITIVENEKRLNENTTEVFYFHPAPIFETPNYFAPRIKGHQRPYKYHK